MFNNNILRIKHNLNHKFTNMDKISYYFYLYFSMFNKLLNYNANEDIHLGGCHLFFLINLRSLK